MASFSQGTCRPAGGGIWKVRRKMNQLILENLEQCEEVAVFEEIMSSVCRASGS